MVRSMSKMSSMTADTILAVGGKIQGCCWSLDGNTLDGKCIYPIDEERLALEREERLLQNDFTSS